VVDLLAAILVAMSFLFFFFVIYQIIRLGFLIYKMSSFSVRRIFPIALFLMPSILPESSIQLRRRLMKYFVWGVFLSVFIIAISIAKKSSATGNAVALRENGHAIKYEYDRMNAIRCADL